MSEEVFRGSWIPVTARKNNWRYQCPFCGRVVYMEPHSPTYPTCPFCLSDMPEAEDFDTPEELADAKRGNQANTGKKYSVDPADNANKRAKRRQYYSDNRDKEREYQRKYYAKHRERILAQQRISYIANREKRLEYQRQYREEHREEINEAVRQKRKENPEKFKKYQIRAKGKPMREVEAHIKGVPVDEIPERTFRYGKGHIE